MSNSIEPWIAILKQRQTQLLVTGFALLAYFAGFHIPLPFIPQEMPSNVQLANRFSVFALALSPWIYSVAVAELLLLIFPRLRADSRLENRHANPFGERVVAFAFIISFFQGLGLANAMAALAQPQLTTSYLSLFPAAISLTAGLAIVIALAGLIERPGIGMGFWVMLVAGAIFSLANRVTEIPSMVANGRATYSDLLIWGILSILSIAALVSLVMLHQRKGHDAIGILIWPWILGDVLLTPILAALQFALPIEWSGFLFSHSIFFFTLINGLLVLSLVTIYSGHKNSSPLKWLTLIVLALVLIATNVWESSLSRLLSLGVLDLTLLAFASVNIFSQYIESQRQTAMAHALRPRTHL
jgi:hypothetical protein